MDVGALQVGEVVGVGDGLLEGVDGLGVVCIIETQELQDARTPVSGEFQDARTPVSG